jgi:hypothetical protein
VLLGSFEQGFVDPVWLHPAQQLVEGNGAVIVNTWNDMLAQKRSPREALSEARRLMQPVYDDFARNRPKV